MTSEPGGRHGDQTDAKTKKIRIVTVKRTGIVWFERMEEGIKQFAAQNQVDATMIGADDADPQRIAFRMFCYDSYNSRAICSCSR